MQKVKVFIECLYYYPLKVPKFNSVMFVFVQGFTQKTISISAQFLSANFFANIVAPTIAFRFKGQLISFRVPVFSFRK